jgi:hypothetical protein
MQKKLKMPLNKACASGAYWEIIFSILNVLPAYDGKNPKFCLCIIISEAE